MSNFVLDHAFRVNAGEGAVVANKFVSASGTDGYIDTTPSLGGSAIGVVMAAIDATKTATGNAQAQVRLMGIAPVIVDSTMTIAFGDKIATTATGTAKIASAGQNILGIALQAGTNLAVIDVLLGAGGAVLV